MPGNEKTISLRQRMIDRIFAEKDLLENLSYHYGVDVGTVKIGLLSCTLTRCLEALLWVWINLKRQKRKKRRKILSRTSFGYCGSLKQLPSYLSETTLRGTNLLERQGTH